MKLEAANDDRPELGPLAVPTPVPPTVPPSLPPNYEIKELPRGPSERR